MQKNNSSANDAPSPYTDARQNAVVAVLAFAGMGAAFMQTVLIPIQGELPALLDADAASTAWVITVTLLAAAICTPIVGKLGDMFGKRRIALILMALLVAGSVLCALAPGLTSMIIGRALQGTGMGVIPLGMALLRDVVDARRLGTSIALVSATLGVGGAIGLPISALVTENFEWHMLFVFATIVSAAALLLIWFVVPASGVQSGGRVDVLGAVGLAIGLTGILLAISQGNTWGWSSLPTLLSLVIGIVALGVWALYELRVTNPLVDLRVSTKPAVLMTNLAAIALGFALFSSNIAFPQLLQAPESVGGLGTDLLTASIMLMPAGLAMLAMSPIAGRIERRVGGKPLLISGATIIASAYLLCLVVPLEGWVIAVVNAIIGIGIGLGYASMPSLIMSAVPRSETGAANGLNTLMRALGTTAASAIVAAILATASDANVASSYQMVFIMGVVAAVVCALLGFLIPQKKPVGTVSSSEAFDEPELVDA